MKSFLISTQALVIALLISACGAAPAAPAVDPADLESTAVAAAHTLLAETQAAIPTATPTATLTAAPTFTATIPPLPTLDVTFTPLPATQEATVDDPCVTTPMPDSLEGQPIKIRIDNPTKSTLMLSVNLHPGNPQGVCGYRGYTLSAGDSLVITDLVEGCYTLWAWNPDPDDYFIVTNGTNCLDNSNNWTFDITPGSIRLKE
ncbi:MAG: hypothetical protein R3307_09540 [Anaerolineales bacterium]|nr:hypothetical protein [Anaerolineales bacterium]